jgi:glycosyltransferase involved in cell wall biosynthesis
MPQPQNGFVLSVGDDVGRDFDTFIEAARGTGKEFVIKAKRAFPNIPGDATVRSVRELISYRALRDLYAQSSVVVVPTHETLNACGVSTILEASAMEKPLVVSDNTALKDFCIPDETCLLVPRQDPGAMRAAILRLLNDPQTAARLARNAREFVVSNFSRPAFAKRLGAVLKEICAQDRSTRA